MTKWVEAFPLPDEQVETILPCVLDVICRHGCPEEILTDQGANFEGNLFKALCRDLGISKQRSAAYFPQCNGLVEHMNRVINNMLSAFDSFGKGEWDILLPQILFAYRVKNQESIKTSPYMALYHRESVIPARLILGENAFPPLSNAFSETEVLKIWKTARMEILKSQMQQKKQFDKRARTTRFEVGDYVMYKKHVRNKLQPRYHPPSKIVQKGPTLN